MLFHLHLQVNHLYLKIPESAITDSHAKTLVARSLRGLYASHECSRMAVKRHFFSLQENQARDKLYKKLIKKY